MEGESMVSKEETLKIVKPEKSSWVNGLLEELTELFSEWDEEQLADIWERAHELRNQINKGDYREQNMAVCLLMAQMFYLK